MNQQTNKLVLVKRLKGWLALMMAVTMLFGSSMTVFAADTILILAYGSDTVPGITVGDVLDAGDTISWKTAGTGAFATVSINVDDIQVGENDIIKEQNGNRYYTLPGEEGIEYRVTVVDFDEENCNISIELDSGSAVESNPVDDGKMKKEPQEPQKPQEPKENEEQIFTRELLEQAAGAKSGDSMVIDATLWHSFNANVLKELLGKEGVSYTFYYNYGGECFYITIPAGAVLEEGCEWYGPLKLNAMFGRTMIDKKDLHAAINK